jgi:hypothetical protein
LLAKLGPSVVAKTLVMGLCVMEILIAKRVSAYVTRIGAAKIVIFLPLLLLR